MDLSLAHTVLQGYLFPNKFFAGRPLETTYTSLAIGGIGKLEFSTCFVAKIHPPLNCELASVVPTLILPAKIPY